MNVSKLVLITGAMIYLDCLLISRLRSTLNYFLTALKAEGTFSEITALKAGIIEKV